MNKDISKARFEKYLKYNIITVIPGITSFGILIYISIKMHYEKLY